MPVFMDGLDGTKYADIVLIDDSKSGCYKNDETRYLYCLEFKRKEVSINSAAAQCTKYADVLEKQLYLKNKMERFIVAPAFERNEMNMAVQLGVKPVKYIAELGKIYRSIK
jgi:hypothetical protein